MRVCVCDNYVILFDICHSAWSSNEIAAIAACLALAAAKASLEPLLATAPAFVAFAASSTSWLRLFMAVGRTMIMQPCCLLKGHQHSRYIMQLWWGMMGNRLLWVGSRVLKWSLPTSIMSCWVMLILSRAIAIRVSFTPLESASDVHLLSFQRLLLLQGASSPSFVAHIIWGSQGCSMSRWVNVWFMPFASWCGRKTLYSLIVSHIYSAIYTIYCTYHYYHYSL